jgi:thermostable 8-oxoguanine DNA glycosylase
MSNGNVDPVNIPEAMDELDREYWLLFSICVANKSAEQTDKKMRLFMALSCKVSPFDKVRDLIAQGVLDKALHIIKFGQYRRIEKAFRAVVDLDLKTLEAAQPDEAADMLMKIPGIGPKTARMYLMYAFPAHADLWAPLDTHVLKFLRSQGYDAPKSTPPRGILYDTLERAFRREAEKRGMTMRELDTAVWTAYSEGRELSI